MLPRRGVTIALSFPRCCALSSRYKPPLRSPARRYTFYYPSRPRHHVHFGFRRVCRITCTFASTRGDLREPKEIRDVALCPHNALPNAVGRPGTAAAAALHAYYIMYVCVPGRRKRSLTSTDDGSSVRPPPVGARAHATIQTRRRYASSSDTQPSVCMYV